MRKISNLSPPKPLDWQHAEQLLSRGNDQVLLEQVVALHSEVGEDPDVIIVEGLVPNNDFAYADKLNEAMARALDAQVILVTAPDRSGHQSSVTDHLVITSQGYGQGGAKRILGCIVNQLEVDLPSNPERVEPSLDEAPALTHSSSKSIAPIREQLERGFKTFSRHTIAPQFTWLRAKDVAKQLDAQFTYEGEAEIRRHSDSCENRRQ